MTTKHSQVRQVLMNELGLTKEVVRQEMYEIIREELRKEMDNPDFVHVLRNAILHPKYGLKSKIVERCSDLIKSDILRRFYEFLKSNPLIEE